MVTYWRTSFKANTMLLKRWTNKVHDFLEMVILLFIFTSFKCVQGPTAWYVQGFHKHPSYTTIGVCLASAQSQDASATVLGLGWLSLGYILGGRWLIVEVTLGSPQGRGDNMSAPQGPYQWVMTLDVFLHTHTYWKTLTVSVQRLPG